MAEPLNQIRYGGIDEEVLWGPPPTGPCRRDDHPLTVRGRDSLTGEEYIECACAADREYDQATKNADG